MDILSLESGDFRTYIPEAKRNVSGVNSSEKILRSAIPGTVISVNVTVGQRVKRGDLLYVLDSMKMNNRICASEEGVVAQLYIKEGDSVSKNAPMVEFE